MPQQINDLAENKLSILYFVKCLGIPLTNSQITQFFIENNFMNYFVLQQSFIELVSGELLDSITAGNMEFFVLTPKGDEVLSFFQHRITPYIKNSIETFAELNRDRLKKESQLTSDYKRISDKEYEVTCKVREKNLILLELKLNVPSSEQAKIICENWKLRAPEVFKAIMDRLI